MDFLVLLFLFLFGLALGSFTNVLVDRIPQKRSISHGRSQCDSCKKTLSWYDLIPLFSYLFIKGRCRRCKAKIPLRILAVEVTTALLSIGLYLYVLFFTLPFYFFFYFLIIGVIFIAIFFTDLEYGIIPDVYNIILLIVVGVFQLIHPTFSANNLLSAVFSFLFFFSLFFFTKGAGMGFGDVKLSFTLGIILGFPHILLSLYLSFILGAFISVLLIVLGKKRLKKSSIPFGPFLVFSAFISLLAGEKIILFILKLFSLP